MSGDLNEILNNQQATTQSKDALHQLKSENLVLLTMNDKK